MVYYPNDAKTMHVTRSLALSSNPEGGLICIRGSHIGQLISLPPDQPIIFGRDATVCQYTMNDIQVSRQHCQITFVPALKKYRVIDLSSNGTFTGDGVRLVKNKEYYMPSSSELYMGNSDHLYKFR